MSSGEFDYSCEASDESSEGELMERSLSIWHGFTCYEKDNDFIPLALDLHTASSIGHCDCVRQIIQKGGEDLNRKNRGGWTALMYACYIGHDAVVNLLLNAGVSVNTNNARGHSPLMLAASCGNETVAYSLMQKSVDIESRDVRGWTALFHATYSGHQNMVRFLVDNGANINAVEPEREWTPLLEASAAGHEIIVKYFLQNGVNVNAKSRSAETARSLALANGHSKIVLLLDNHVKAPLSRPEPVSSITDGPKAFEVLMAKQQLSGSVAKGKNVSNTDSLENDEYPFYAETGVETMINTPGSSGDLAAVIKNISPKHISASSERKTPSEKPSMDDNSSLPNGVHPSPSPVRSNSKTSNSSPVAYSPSSPKVIGGVGAPSAHRPTRNRPSDIAVLLQELDLTKYLTVFEEQDIDLQVFLTLTDSDLKQIGIEKFGPRKKMTNAIARWHSNAPLSGNGLEQAYADKLETEMQEMAIRLHQACEQLDHVKLQLLQERELRSVTEDCLMEDRTLWTQVISIAADTLEKCNGMGGMLNTVSECSEELVRRFTVDARLTDSGNRNTMVAALLQGLALGAGPPEGLGGDAPLSTPHLVQRLRGTKDLLMQTLAVIFNNTEKLLKRQYNTTIPGHR